jgi:hypothetical protein
MKVMWIITLVGAVLGGGNFLFTTLYAVSAPQQAAGAAIAVAAAVIPYCMARAVEGLKNRQ